MTENDLDELGSYIDYLYIFKSSTLHKNIHAEMKWTFFKSNINEKLDNHLLFLKCLQNAFPSTQYANEENNPDKSFWSSFEFSDEVEEAMFTFVFGNRIVSNYEEARQKRYKHLMA